MLGIAFTGALDCVAWMQNQSITQVIQEYSSICPCTAPELHVINEQVYKETFIKHQRDTLVFRNCGLSWPFGRTFEVTSYQQRNIPLNIRKGTRGIGILFMQLRAWGTVTNQVKSSVGPVADWTPPEPWNPPTEENNC